MAVLSYASIAAILTAVQILTMTVAADVVLAEAELEHDELLAARLLHDLAGDLRTGRPSAYRR